MSEFKFNKQRMIRTRNEIGSEFNLPLSQLSTKDYNILDYLKTYNPIFYDSGRSAIKSLVKNINNSTVLLPEYICNSVIECFYHKKIKYYKLNEDFSINIFDLEKNINKDISLIFIMHYFGGLQPWHILEQVSEIAKKTNALIVEDVTHSLFTKPMTIGDYTIASLRKWVPVPDGGLLYSYQTLEQQYIKRGEYDIKYELKTAGMLLKDFYLRGLIDTKEIYREFLFAAEHELNRQKEIFQMSDLSHFLLSCIAVPELISKRKKNYARLNEGLKKLGLRAVCSIKSSECPFVFPLRISSRDSFRQYLIDNDIYCAVHWPFDGQDSSKRPFAAHNASNLISLPIDQRYTDADMDRIVHTIEQYHGI